MSLLWMKLMFYLCFLLIEKIGSYKKEWSDLGRQYLL